MRSLFRELRVATTRRIGPLHLEDLEPHRFEDLVRQLIYDFRSWRSLEATGRAGSDDGFDARGTEIIPGEANADEHEDEEEAPTPPNGTRVWLIQCKREKAIAAKKLTGYLEALPEADSDGLYGIIFAAACNFSKTARDAFLLKARERGFMEAYVWGKGEIEDMLFQPKNDHLLFAYFGFSLKTRQRSLKTEVRARLATKRKAQRLLEQCNAVLIRDATDDRYPHLDPEEARSRIDRGRWTVLTFKGCFSDGLHFLVDRHFAYVGDDEQEWDYAERMNDGPVHRHENPWRKEEEDDHEARAAAMAEWEVLPERNRAWFEVLAVLPYENILDIDEKGDEYSGLPHIYTTAFDHRKGPFHHYCASVETIDRWGVPLRASPEEDKRVQKFNQNPSETVEDQPPLPERLPVPDDEPSRPRRPRLDRRPRGSGRADP